MKQTLLFVWKILCFLLMQSAIASPPDPPKHLQIQRQNGSFVVTWDVPAHAYGKLTRYVVTSALLPEGNKTYLRVPAISPIAFISCMDHLGKLYRIAVQAENQDGLSPPSTASYIRAPCGYTIYLPPGKIETISSPKYPFEYESGVLCKWQVSTNRTHVISLEFEEIDFGGKTDCDTAEIYVTVKNIPNRICSKREELDLRYSEGVISFKSKVVVRGGRGFRINIKTKEKTPGLPSNVTLKAYQHSIHINWGPPLDDVLPVTSYKLRYTILPSSKRVIILPAHMLWFSINTRGFEGRLISVQISAVRKQMTGDFVGPFFVRAACQYEVKISQGQILNLTSPNYPDPYPPGIFCHWTVLPITPFSELILNIRWMDIHQTLLCSGDYISFSISGNARQCGYMKDHILRTKNKSVTITMKTDFDDTRRSGFFIQTYLSTVVSSTLMTTKSLTEQTTPFHNFTHPFLETKHITTDILVSSSTSYTANETTLETKETKTTSVVPLSSSFSSLESSVPSVSIYSSTSVYANSTHTASSPESTISTATASDKRSSISSSLEISTLTTTTRSSPVLNHTLSSLRTNSQTTMFPYTHNTAEPRRLSRPSTPKRVENNIHYYEPNLVNSTVPVHIVFAFKRRQHVVTQNFFPLKRTVVHNCLFEIFNESSLFCGLKVERLRSKNQKMLADVTVTFNTEPVLQKCMFSESFQLIPYVNQTFLEDMSGVSLKDKHWEMDEEAMQEFRKSPDFSKQEIKSKCDYVSTCSANYSCVEMQSASSGVICCPSYLAKCSNTCVVTDTGNCLNKTHPLPFESKAPKEKDDEIVIILSVFSLSLFVIIVVIVLVSLKLRRMTRQKSMPVQNSGERVELHDILQSNFVGNKNIEFTAFTPKQKSGRLGEKFNGWSLPSRNILKKCEIPDIANGTNHNLRKYFEENGHLSLKHEPKTLKRQHSL